MANTFKRLLVRNLSAALSTVANYTANTATTTILIGITACNTSADAVTVDFGHYNGAATTYVVKNAPIPAGGTLVMSDNLKMVLTSGDSLKSKASANSAIDLTVSILEIT